MAARILNDAKKTPPEAPRECELKAESFCDGKDVRRIQRLEGLPRVRTTYHYWCAGCRKLMSGSFRYDK